ncbi:hypothetical protein, partial [Intrasporangium sp.]|uniref:hypothetical protein n=1 Tax=Intrasporangium sp. TaxID=1925024 RepID=UPI002939FFD4
MRTRVAAVAILAVLALGATLWPASADGGPCDGSWGTCGTDPEGAFVEGMSRQEVLNLPSHPGGKAGSPKADANRPVYEYSTIAD